MINPKKISPSSLTATLVRCYTETNALRVTTKGLNTFNVYFDRAIGYITRNNQNGAIYSAPTLSEIKYYIGCTL